MIPARGEHVDVIADARLTAHDRADTLSGSSPYGDEPVDLHLKDGLIADIAPAGALARRGSVLDAGGGWVIPGLWDHHIHTTQWALVAQRTSVADAATAGEAAQMMADAPVLDDGRRIGIGFRDALWPDIPTLPLLDATTGDVPTYLINADVHSIWLNSAALRREGMDPSSGMLREAPAFEVSRRLNDVTPVAADRLVTAAAAAAAVKGVVGVVDLDMAWNEDAWARRLGHGFDALRVEFGIYPDLLGRAVAEGVRTGATVRGAASDLVRVGPLKVITDGSLGTRTAAVTHPYAGESHGHGMMAVDRGELITLMTTATAAGLRCAVHAIGDVANSIALDAFAVTEAWGTIEHAQLVAHADIPRFARLGVGASVQPEHAVDDRDITDSLWSDQTAVAYPLRALADTGATLLIGSDAPVSPLDPWAAFAAAVWRTRDGRQPWRPEQAIDPRTALAASTHGGSGRDAAFVEPGAVADLVVCGRDPLSSSETELRTMPVVATLLGGRLTHVA